MCGVLKCCTKNVFALLRSASHQAAKPAWARESLPQLRFRALHPATRGQLLKTMPGFCVRKTLRELALFVTPTLDPGGEAWRRPGPPDGGTLHPVDLREHGIPAMR